VGRSPLWGSKFSYSPRLLSSELGWTALDVRRCCVQLFSILWFIRRPGEGGPNPVHSCTTQHYSTRQILDFLNPMEIFALFSNFTLEYTLPPKYVKKKETPWRHELVRAHTSKTLLHCGLKGRLLLRHLCPHRRMFPLANLQCIVPVEHSSRRP